MKALLNIPSSFVLFVVRFLNVTSLGNTRRVWIYYLLFVSTRTRFLVRIYNRESIRVVLVFGFFTRSWIRLGVLWLVVFVTMRNIFLRIAIVYVDVTIPSIFGLPGLSELSHFPNISTLSLLFVIEHLIIWLLWALLSRPFIIFIDFLILGMISRLINGAVTGCFRASSFWISVVVSLSLVGVSMILS